MRQGQAVGRAALPVALPERRNALLAPRRPPPGAPNHPGNIRRLLGGVFAAQAAYRLELKTLGEYWNLLTTEEKQDVQSHFIPKARRDMKILDWAARFYLSRFDDDCHGWYAFMKQMRVRRLLASQW